MATALDPRIPAAADDEDTLDPNRLEIDLAAIDANLRAIRAALGPRRKIVGVLKADAYGHGIEAVARTLEAGGVDYLAVGSLDDGRRLRTSGARAPTLLLGGFLPESAPAVLALDLIATVDDETTVLALAHAATSPAPVCVKVDCGFGRYGVPLDPADALVDLVLAQRQLRLEGIYTHVPFADAAGRAWAERRIRVFEGFVAALERRGVQVKLTQALASPGLVAEVDDRLGAGAIGHSLFGLQPVDPAASAAAPVALVPALRAVTTRLLHRGSTTGGEEAALYLRGRARALGVVPLGISQGYRPALGEAFMLVNGARAPVLRASLESAVLDLGAAGDAAPGAEVVVLGAQGGERVTLGDLARWHATTELAMAITLGRSLPRRYVR